MSTIDLTASAARAFVDQLVVEGLTDVVVAPGSRSAPLALACARHAGLRVHVVLDERSAGFVALGLGKAAGRAAAVVCTSGTAAVNFHPAVVEAHHARVPLLVCTADRPPELQGVGAPQTIDQRRLYGTAVRSFADPGAPETVEGLGRWRAVAAAAWQAAHGAPAGPAHVNLPFREPLVTAGHPVADVPRLPIPSPSAPAMLVESIVDSTTRVVREHPHGMLVLGFGAALDAAVVDAFAESSGWPVLADPVSSARRGEHAVSAYEALVRTERFASEHRPDAVLRVGGPLTSKAANAWLAGARHHVLVDADGTWLDPDRAATARVVADPSALLWALGERLTGVSGADPARTEWRAAWRAAEQSARAALDAALDAGDDPLDARVARDVAGVLPDGSVLLVASSLPVRALEWTMRPRDKIRVLANRGANGIDGFTSTAIGAALGSGGPTVALLGDLCFLHDTNGLLGATTRDLDIVFVVVDNDGGGIFAMLPPAAEPEFEALFATPHGLDLVEVARSHGAHASRVDQASAVTGAVRDAIAAGGVHVLVVPVDRTTSVERHRALWDAVAARV